MKNIKKLFFALLLLFVGIVTVKAEIAGVYQRKDVRKWESFVGVMDSTAIPTNSCKMIEGANYGSTFVHKETNTCVMTAIGEVAMDASEHGGYSFAFQGAAGGLTDTFAGNFTASTNNLNDTNILLSEIVELIYNGDAATTKKLKSLANLQTDWAAGGTDYILKAGSSNNALYVFGCYAGSDGKCITSTEGSIKLDYNASTKKFTFEMAPTASNIYDFRLAQFFTHYLVNYLMEATPNYSEAMNIINDKDKYQKIENDFKNTYGSVAYPDNDGDGYADEIKVDLIAKGDINSQIVTLYNNAGTGGSTGGSTGGTTGGSTGGTTGGSTGGSTSSGTTTEDDDVPNTGAFVNIFAIVALLSVGTVLVLGNKRKLFKI